MILLISILLVYGYFSSEYANKDMLLGVSQISDECKRTMLLSDNDDLGNALRAVFRVCQVGFPEE